MSSVSCCALASLRFGHRDKTLRVFSGRDLLDWLGGAGEADPLAAARRLLAANRVATAAAEAEPGAAAALAGAAEALVLTLVAEAPPPAPGQPLNGHYVWQGPARPATEVRGSVGRLMSTSSSKAPTAWQATLFAPPTAPASGIMHSATMAPSLCRAPRACARGSESHCRLLSDYRTCPATCPLSVLPYTQVVTSLRGLILELYDAHLSPDGRTVDYRALKSDPRFRAFVDATAELQKVGCARSPRAL